MADMRKLEFGVVDLHLLKRQKEILLEVRTTLTWERHTDAIDGVVNLLDAIEDHLEGREWR